MTNYVAELVQHDTSHHLWAPLAGIKWYLITTLDDYSRYLLYADLWERERSWAHISALESVVMRFGCPLKYYVDQHSIFKYVEQRDTIRKKHHITEEDAIVQWKEVLRDVNVGVIYALSPQAKGKIERPYRWLQDRLVRTCMRDGVRNVNQARDVLQYELDQYNNKRVHSTTLEIPRVRLERAIEEKRSLFRKFVIKKPYKLIEDIFCLRVTRTVNPYRRISIDNLKLNVSGVPIGEKVELRIRPSTKTKMANIRFWYRGQLVGQQQVKVDDLRIVQF